MTTTSIYELHDKAFAQVSAFVVLQDGQRVATVAFKFPKDGAGRLYAYVHWIGSEMTRGFAGGYGYDKRTAAVSVAARKVVLSPEGIAGQDADDMRAFVEALSHDNGWDWNYHLRHVGFEVFQAV